MAEGMELAGGGSPVAWGDPRVRYDFLLPIHVQMSGFRALWLKVRGSGFDTGLKVLRLRVVGFRVVGFRAQPFGVQD